MAPDALDELAGALARRAETAPGGRRRERAERLRRHVADYLAPRARDLSAPLVVVLLGSTGAGKSSLLNTLAGAAVSPSGVLRPTTRRPVALVHPEDAALLRHRHLLPGLISRDVLDVVPHPGGRRGLVLVDAPDFDSVELENRALAIELLESADLVVFVTTAARYADQVPWDVLARAQQRGVPLLTVLNRLQPEAEEAGLVVEDYRRMLDRARLTDAGADGALTIVPVGEGAVDPERDGLRREAVGPLLATLDRLMEDAEARRTVARRSLEAALAGLPDAIEEVAREIDAERAAVDQLLEQAEGIYAERRSALGEELSRGTFLRAEVLRQWLDFVNAGRVARFLAEGIGKLTGAVRAVLRPAPAGAEIEVREAAFADLVALAVAHADTAAARTAGSWAEDQYGGRVLELDRSLWVSSPNLADRLSAGLDEWAAGIAESIRQLGSQKRGVARAASLGVNAVGTSLVLAVFLHTGGLTGAEVGITAGAAVVNQKLLEAIFGEATLRSFLASARENLARLLDEAFFDERERFTAALGPLAHDEQLATQLRDAADRASRQLAA